MAKQISVKEGVEEFLSGNRNVRLILSRPLDEGMTLGQLMDYQEFEAHCEIPVPEPEKSAVKAAGYSESGGGTSNPGNRKRIDRGKVLALHNAGWTNKSIAEEIGCSEWSVSMILKEERTDEGSK